MPGAAPALLTAGVVLALALSVLALLLAARAATAGGAAGRRPARRPPAGPPHRGAEPPPAPGGRSLDRVGIVRFNAYHDTGGDYSFAVALLDSGGTGVLLSGLYHRDRCRVYAKPVRAWESAYELTDEERQAVDQARAGGADPALL